MKEIKYTATAKDRLDHLHAELNEKIEDYIRTSKYNIGEDFIEVTASDIEEIKRRIKILKPLKPNFSSSLLIYFSIAMGAILTFIGIFYDWIIKIFYEGDTTRIILISYGLLMLLFGLFYLLIFRQRKLREKAYYDKMEFDKIMKQISDYKE